MNSIQSDSLFSSPQNLNYQQHLKPYENTSSIFRSLFEHLPSKPKSILIQSIVDINPHHLQPHPSLPIDSIITAGYRQHPSITFSTNWTISKNQGVSEQEDNNISCQHQVPQIKPHEQVKQQPKSDEHNIQNHCFFYQFSEPKKIKNQTKNIPKNYGKAIISFIQKYRHKIERIANHLGIDYDLFLADLKMKKKSINTIADLRTLWSGYRYAKCMRVISGLFLRKYALSYIFSSRICTYTSHIKYRQRLYQAVSSPEEFRHIKDY